MPVLPSSGSFVIDLDKEEYVDDTINKQPLSKTTKEQMVH